MDNSNSKIKETDQSTELQLQAREIWYKPKLVRIAISNTESGSFTNIREDTACNTHT